MQCGNDPNKLNFRIEEFEEEEVEQRLLHISFNSIVVQIQIRFIAQCSF